MSRISSLLTPEFYQSAMFLDFYFLSTLYGVSTYIQKNESNAKLPLDLIAGAVEAFHRHCGLWGTEIINGRCIMSRSSFRPNSLSSVCSGTVFNCRTSTFWQCVKPIWTKHDIKGHLQCPKKVEKLKQTRWKRETDLCFANSQLGLWQYLIFFLLWSLQLGEKRGFGTLYSFTECFSDQTRHTN